jgi:predicted unusual protein kinase regulating ubiquinone biosynthesis (AarF/ABC1/UbiB family)
MIDDLTDKMQQHGLPTWDLHTSNVGLTKDGRMVSIDFG